MGVFRAVIESVNHGCVSGRDRICQPLEGKVAGKFVVHVTGLVMMPSEG